MPMLGTHDQYFFPGRHTRASLGTRGPAREWATPTQQGKGRREVSGVSRVGCGGGGGHEGTKTGEVSKMSCSGPSTFPAGERQGEKEETDERGHQWDKGDSGHSTEKRLEGMKQQGTQGDRRVLWDSGGGDREQTGAEAGSVTLRRWNSVLQAWGVAPNPTQRKQPSSICPSAYQQAATWLGNDLRSL